jgi:hypothetical protein
VAAIAIVGEITNRLFPADTPEPRGFLHSQSRPRLESSSHKLADETFAKEPTLVTPGEQDMNYSDQGRLEPREIRSRLFNDTLWLGITGFAGAAIIGILCWPISAELSPRIRAGAASVSPTVRAVAETGASAVGNTLASGYGGNRIPPPVTPLTTPEEGVERASIVASINPIAAPTEPNGTKLSPLDPNADRPPAEPLADRGKLTPAPRAPQQNQSTAPSQSHQLGSPRVRQPHQPAQPTGRPQKSELVPQ